MDWARAPSHPSCTAVNSTSVSGLESLGVTPGSSAGIYQALLPMGWALLGSTVEWIPLVLEALGFHKVWACKGCWERCAEAAVWGGPLEALLKSCRVSTRWADLKPQTPPPNLLLFLLNLWAKHSKREKQKKTWQNTMVKSVLFRVAALSSISATLNSSWFDWDWPHFETENFISQDRSQL